MFKPEQISSTKEMEEKITETKLEKETEDLEKFLKENIEKFREKNPEASVKETVEFIVSQRKEYIYGEKGERKEDIKAVRQDILEATSVRFKPTKKGWFGITLEGRMEILPQSISSTIREIYRDIDSWDEAYSTAADTLTELRMEEKK